MKTFPPISQTLILLIVVLFSLLVLSSNMPDWGLVPSLLITQGIFIFPMLLLLLGRYDLRRTLALSTPRWAAWPATLIVISGAWLVGIGLVYLQDSLLPFPEDFIKRFEELFRGLNELPLLASLGLVALLPGICEELVCRGFILHSLLPQLNRWAAVSLTALIFGMLHLDPFRLLPTVFLGFLFGWIVIWTGSIFPAIFAHIVNNTCSYLIARHQDSMAEITWLNPETLETWPWWAIIPGVMLTAAGLLWLKRSGRRPDSVGDTEQALHDSLDMTETSPSITITGLLNRARDKWPDRPYLQIRVGETLNSLSFSEVAAEAETVARLLFRKGVKPGDRIALLAENRPAWVIAYYAILLSGGIVVPVDSLMSPPEIVNVLRLAKARMLLTTNRFLDDLRSAADFRELAFELILLDRDLRPAEADSTGGLDHSPHSGDIAVIIFTSGTTGYSKGVVLTHGNLCADVQAIMEAGVLRSSDSFLLLLPLHHTYSSTVNMLGTLALGSRALFATSYKSRDIMDDIRIGKISMLVGVPQVFENLMIGIRRAVADSPAGKRILFRAVYVLSDMLFRLGFDAGGALFRSLRGKAGMGTLRHMVSGGAALPANINRFFVNLGFKLLQGYGLTETSPVLSVNRPKAIRIGSVGTAMPGIELRIDSPDKDGIGEICARGPVVMQGYYDNPEASADVLRDGWFYTGDAGYLDRDGYLYITGRIKNIIVTGAGKNIYPEPIEAQLNSSPFVLESLVVGVKAKRGVGEELAAIIVPHKTYIETERERGHTIDVAHEIQAVVEAYNHSAPAHRRLRQWKIRDAEFEKTSTRKIRRYLYMKEF